MVVTGHDDVTRSDHATRIMSFANAMLAAASALNESRLTTDPSMPAVLIRIGIGEAVSAALGRRNPKCSFFGDTVNTASRCALARPVLLAPSVSRLLSYRAGEGSRTVMHPRCRSGDFVSTIMMRAGCRMYADHLM